MYSQIFASLNWQIKNSISSYHAKNQQKHAKHANCESSNPQEQQHDSDEDVSTPGKEIGTKYIRARGKPDRYYQKNMDNFFKKYPEEEEKILSYIAG